MTLDHTKLDVYHRALDLLDLLDRTIEQLPPGLAHLKDQLDRAWTSVVLNIAEGAGELSLGDKQRFYRMAKRSAIESAAVLDVLARRSLISSDAHGSLTTSIASVVSVLTALATSQEGRGKGKGRGRGERDERRGATLVPRS